jgi:ABC-type amino acid transport system permease subunit
LALVASMALNLSRGETFLAVGLPTVVMTILAYGTERLAFPIESKDERESEFSHGTFSKKMSAITTGVSFVPLVLSTVLGTFHTVMNHHSTSSNG